MYSTSGLFSLHNTCKYAMMMTLKSIKLPIFIYPIISELNVSSVCLPVYLVVYVYSTLYSVHQSRKTAGCAGTQPFLIGF